jgi:bifunctional UDP-N-acetylglucosamine pyrophosphorylase/glucosamine-1-phosphate N-acetyltransferase
VPRSDGSSTDMPSPGGEPPTAAVVLAAGEGRRMRSALPKVLHPIGGATLLGHAVAAVAALQPEHLAVVVGHGRDQVSEEVTAVGERLGRVVRSAVQDEQRGTGDAVRCGLAALPAGLTGAVLVTYGDVPLLEPATLAALLAEHTAAGAAVTLLTAEFADPTGYGRVVRDGRGAVRGIV